MTFWKAFWRFLPKTDIHLRLFARLLPTAVLAREARRIDQLNPVLESVTDSNASIAILAKEAVRLIIQSLRTLDITRDELWAQFFEGAVVNPDPVFAWDLAVATYDILERVVPNGDSPTIESCGRIGRQLLQWIWQHRDDDKPWFDALASSWGIRLVTRSYRTDPVASRALLQPVLSHIGEEDYAVDWLFRLVTDLKDIGPVDPEFVAQIYSTVFSRSVSGDAKHVFGGPILPLSIDNRQYYGSCQHQLVEYLPAFLRIAPPVAVAAVIDSSNLFIIGRNIIPYTTDVHMIDAATQSFEFRGSTAAYLADYSYIWDEGGIVDYAIEMAYLLFNHISSLASNQETKDIDVILDQFRDRARAAFFWRRLLVAGTHASDWFASRLVDLCAARPIQIGVETIFELGEFLKSKAKAFSSSDLERIERSIISIPDTVEEDESLIYRRDRLLACIPEALLQTLKGRAIRAAMAGQTPQNTPVATSSVEFGEYSEADWPTDQGVDIGRAANELLIQHFAALADFSSRFLNEVPSEGAVRGVRPFIDDVYSMLTSGFEADEAVLTSAWTHVAACTAVISRAASRLDNGTLDLCRRVLLASAYDPHPIAGQESAFTSPHWSPSPRTEAAQGLLRLAQRKADDETIEAIRHLVHDPAPSVRFLIVRELNIIADAVADVFWELAADIAANEMNQVVLDTLCGMLGRMVISQEVRTTTVLAQVYKRAPEDQFEHLPDSFVAITLWLAFVRENDWALAVANTIAQEPILFAPILQKAALNALTCITPEAIGLPQSREVADRAIDWLIALIDSVSHAINDMPPTGEELSSEDRMAKIKDLYMPVDETVLRLYFAAGIDRSLPDEANKGVSEEQRGAFYHAVRPVLERVLRFATTGGNSFITASTADLFMKLLNGVIKYDPKRVLHMAADLVQAAEKANYNLDPMAASQVAHFAETILADCREDVQEGQALIDLLNLLDSFAKVGWPEALRLVWRLDEVFR